MGGEGRGTHFPAFCFFVLSSCIINSTYRGLFIKEPKFLDAVILSYRWFPDRWRLNDDEPRPMGRLMGGGKTQDFAEFLPIMITFCDDNQGQGGGGGMNDTMVSSPLPPTAGSHT